jgi:hypothetical protein
MCTKVALIFYKKTDGAVAKCFEQPFTSIRQIDNNKIHPEIRRTMFEEAAYPSFLRRFIFIGSARDQCIHAGHEFI